MQKNIYCVTVLLAALLAAPAAAAHEPPDEARVFFVRLQDGERVASPFTVRFGIEGFGVAPADVKGHRRHVAGHFHLLVDAPGEPDLGEPIPVDEHHRHYNGGETQATLDLPPGEHRLRLVLADEEHEQFEPTLMSEEITIIVSEPHSADASVTSAPSP